MSDDCREKLEEIEDKLLNIYDKRKRSAFALERFDAEPGLKIVRRSKETADKDCEDVLNDIENKLLTIIDKRPYARDAALDELFEMIRATLSRKVTWEPPPSSSAPSASA
jgi:sugar-specific transcriptional regulator TrmB